MKRHFAGRLGILSCGLSLALGAPGLNYATAADAQNPVAATSPAASATLPMRDIKLSAGGRLDGAIYDCQGAPKPATPVMLIYKDQMIASVTTDANGRFAITGLRGGEYTLAASDGVTLCRLWTEGTAPPSARAGVQVYEGDLVRGQMFKARNVLTSPVIIGAAIGTAIAVPLALHNREPQS